MFNKEGNFFTGNYGCLRHYSEYSMLFPMRLKRLKRLNGFVNKLNVFNYFGYQKNNYKTISPVYFEGYPDYHAFYHLRDRLYAINPNMKFVVMFRNPCDKVISHWCQWQDINQQLTNITKTKQQLNQIFRNHLDVIQSEKYQYLKDFFKDNNSGNIEKYPNGLQKNLIDWINECILGRAMYGHDLQFWMQKFDSIQNWLIIDMKYMLQKSTHDKNTLTKSDKMKNIIRLMFKFLGRDIKSDIENSKQFENWMPHDLKLNQNNIKYQPPKIWKDELIKFYQKDTRMFHKIIKDKNLKYINSDTALFKLLD